MSCSESCTIRMKTLEDALHEHARLFEKLEEAMATPERIAADTALVGGFFSSLDITETAENIVNRACEALRSRP